MLNHMIGDGATYYDVQHLLSCAIKGVPAPRLKWVSSPDSVMVPPHYNADDRVLSLESWQEQCGVDFVEMMKNPRVVGSRSFPFMLSSASTRPGRASIDSLVARFLCRRLLYPIHRHPGLDATHLTRNLVGHFAGFGWGECGHGRCRTQAHDGLLDRAAIAAIKEEAVAAQADASTSGQKVVPFVSTNDVVMAALAEVYVIRSSAPMHMRTT